MMGYQPRYGQMLRTSISVFGAKLSIRFGESYPPIEHTQYFNDVYELASFLRQHRGVADALQARFQ